MKKNLLLTAVLLAAMVVSCTSTGGAAGGNTGEPKVEITLTAAEAELITNGAMVLENGDTNIGYWASTDDQAKWTLDVPEDGEYTVVCRYSCTESQPGSIVKLTVGDQSLEYKVKSTTDWTSYTKREMGKLNLKAGKQTVVAQATKIAAKYVMNLAELIFQKF